MGGRVRLVDKFYVEPTYSFPAIRVHYVYLNLRTLSFILQPKCLKIFFFNFVFRDTPTAYKYFILLSKQTWMAFKLDIVISLNGRCYRIHTNFS